ncbi:esterase family protein, partial [Listeria monocytogenes]|nr:esterase family protein [Listeria monocytogenes]
MGPIDNRTCPGEQDWEFWDKSIKEIINWLPL